MRLLLKNFFLFTILIACTKVNYVESGILPSEILIDKMALTCNQGIYGNIINGQSFQQDAVFSHRGWQYVAYYNNQRKLCIARRQINKSFWEILELAGYKFSAVPAFDNDTHNSISMGYCINDGTIHLAFDTHANPLNYSYSVKGLLTNPNQYKWDSSLFSPVLNSLQFGIPINEFSYPSFVSTNKGDLLLGYRDGYSGVLHYKLAYYDGKLSSWVSPYIIINGSGSYDDYYSGQSNARCAYINGLDIDRQSGMLFVSWTWREDLRGSTTANRDIYAAFSNDNGINWINYLSKEVGTFLGSNKQLITNSDGITVKKIDRGWGLMNQQSQALDRNGKPHIIMYHRNQKKYIPDFAHINDGQYFHYYLKDTGWVEDPINLMGNRPKFLFSSNNDLYLVFLDKDHFDYLIGAGSLIIVKADANSSWANWKTIYKSEKIYFSEPLIDRNRWFDDSVLSIFIQETPSSEGMPSALKLLEFIVQ